MSQVSIGNPWHGRITPDGLVLADETVKTSSSATGTDGNPVTHNYLYPGDDLLANTYYVKTPGLPVPVTPTGLTAEGGQFHNDAILFGKFKRYSPFSARTVGTNMWLHYGSDGVWRRFRMEKTAQTSTTHTIKIYRGLPWWRFEEAAPVGEALIATLVLEVTSPMAAFNTYIPEFDARYDGRQLVVTRYADWSTNETDIPFVPGSGYVPWETSSVMHIVAAWRIDIAADGWSAAATSIWQAERATQTQTTAHNLQSTGVFSYSDPFNIEGTTYRYIYEGYAGTAASFDYLFEVTRLIGVAFAPDGQIHLQHYYYRHEIRSAKYDVSTRGVHHIIIENPGQPLEPLPTTPRPPETWPPGTSYGLDYGTRILIEEGSETRTIEVRDNENVLMTLPAAPAQSVFSIRKSNNAYDLRTVSSSLARLGPGVIDPTPLPLSTTALYAAYNPRTNNIQTRTTPFGFV